jgi:sugar O-acyltransferase (sialic acid O-acetyltransferase NeuD family)
MGAKRIAILGAGGQAREVEWLIREINRHHPIYEFLGYIVADVTRLSEHDSSRGLLGDESWLESNRDRVDCLAIGIGDPTLRLKLAAVLTSRFPDIEWPALIHPRAVFDAATCECGPGLVLCGGAACTVNIKFGAFSLINFGCTIGHDVQVGKGCVVNPGANISGRTILGDAVLVGSGAQVLQYLRVGTGAKIGAGAVVVRNVEAYSTVVGVPARPLKKA